MNYGLNSYFTLNLMQHLQNNYKRLLICVGSVIDSLLIINSVGISLPFYFFITDVIDHSPSFFKLFLYVGKVVC